MFTLINGYKFLFRTRKQEEQYQEICCRIMNAKTHFVNAKTTMSSLKAEKPKIVRNLYLNSSNLQRVPLWIFSKLFIREELHIFKKRHNRINLVYCHSFQNSCIHSVLVFPNRHGNLGCYGLAWQSDGQPLYDLFPG